MVHYVLRFFFDGGCGDCLWSDNDAALEKFGYPVCLSDLGLSEETIATANKIMRRDFQIAQTEPDVCGVCYAFSAEEVAAHLIEVGDLLSAIRIELGTEYEIIDQYLRRQSYTWN